LPAVGLQHCLPRIRHFNKHLETIRTNLAISKPNYWKDIFQNLEVLVFFTSPMRSMGVDGCQMMVVKGRRARG
jgi:hypothetical protein